MHVHEPQRACVRRRLGLPAEARAARTVGGAPQRRGIAGHALERGCGGDHGLGRAELDEPGLYVRVTADLRRAQLQGRNIGCCTQRAFNITAFLCAVVSHLHDEGVGVLGVGHVGIPGRPARPVAGSMGPLKENRLRHACQGAKSRVVEEPLRQSRRSSAGFCCCRRRVAKPAGPRTHELHQPAKPAVVVALHQARQDGGHASRAGVPRERKGRGLSLMDESVRTGPGRADALLKMGLWCALSQPCTHEALCLGRTRRTS